MNIYINNFTNGRKQSKCDRTWLLMGYYLPVQLEQA